MKKLRPAALRRPRWNAIALQKHGTMILSGLFLLLAMAPFAYADRPSLAEIDGKLDAILAKPAVDPNEHVQLRLLGGTTPCQEGRAYRRVLLDGSLEPSEFVVPADKVFLVTDVQWTARDGTTGLQPGWTVYFNILSADQHGGGPAIYTSAPVEITVENQEGRLGSAENMTSGVTVGPGRRLCPNMFSTNQTQGGTNATDTSYVRGVLLPAPARSVRKPVAEQTDKD